MKPQRSFLFIVFFFSFHLSAAEVDTPHEFSSGTPAVAAEVNENFSAHELAIDDNAQQIAEVNENIGAHELAIDDNAQQISTLTTTITDLESENQSLRALLNALVLRATLAPSLDTVVNLNSDFAENPNSITNRVSATEYNNRFALLKFDLSDIPVGATILSAELRLWHASTNPDTPFIVTNICAQQVTADWSESVNATTAPTLDDTCISNSWVINIIAGMHYWSDLGTLVQTWLNESDNFGLALVVAETDFGSVDPDSVDGAAHETTFYSNEGQYKPELVIRYQLPQ